MRAERYRSAYCAILNICLIRGMWVWFFPDFFTHNRGINLAALRSSLSKVQELSQNTGVHLRDYSCSLQMGCQQLILRD